MNPFLPASVQARLILASRSPRRRDLLRALGFEFEVLGSDYYEENGTEADPAATVTRHALGKAVAVARRRPDHLVIGADTLVATDRILGKPADAAAAADMLRALSGAEHRVMTGLALVRADAAGDLRESSAVAATSVRFRVLAEDEIAAYVASGEPFDKAGAYGIQGLAAQFVTGIRGCYFNVMGLPLELLTRMMRDWAAESDPKGSA